VEVANHPHVVDPRGKFHSNFLAIYSPPSSRFDCCMFFGAIQRNHTRLSRINICLLGRCNFIGGTRDCIGWLNRGGLRLGGYENVGGRVNCEKQ
jgi:hypothetical protein